MKARGLAVAAIFSVAAVACGGDAELDSGVEDAFVADAVEVDTGEPDAGHDDAREPATDGGDPPDAGLPFNAASCLPCDMRGNCANGGQCLSANNQSFCADACDEDLFGCVTGFTCYDVDQSMTGTAYFCVSPAASCTLEGVGYGTACFGSTVSCLSFQHFCEGDIYALGYCTDACGNDGDCPPGFICRPGDDFTDVCKPSYLSGPERCGRDSELPQVQCTIDAHCAEGSFCIRSEPTLPGVCALPCASGGVCASGVCRETTRGAFCLEDPCTCHGTPVPFGTRDLFGEALESVELSRCSTIFSVFDWAATPPNILNDPYRLSFYAPIHNEPLTAPGWARGVVGDFDEAAALIDHPATRAARMVERLAELVDRPAVTHAPEVIDPLEPLATSVAALITLAGGTPDLDALRADAADVSMDLQLAVAQIVEASARAVAARQTAIPAASLAALFDFGPAFVVPRADGRGLNPTLPENQTLFNESVGYGELYGAAVDVLDAIAAADLERFRATPSSMTATTAAFSFVAETPIGRVAISDGESGIYNSDDPRFAGAWAILIDLGGDDEYRVPVAGNITADNSVSVLIDVGGDDRYGYVEVPTSRDGARLVSDIGGRYGPRTTPDRENGPISLSQIPRQGGARVGTAIHVDLGAGRDHYQSLRMSQGSGIFGTGVLIDDGGDDRYLAEAMAQGAGSMGIGVLFDGGGTDEYSTYSFSQGFAFARAAGLVYDFDGDDKYTMNVGDPMIGGDPLYFNEQRPGRGNTTLGQGFAFGRRDDTNGGYMSGGIALLIDRAGNDRYLGSVFAQGGGYWFGTGILADQSGDDTYDSLWYGMGAGAHYAVGVLLEGGGNDFYGFNVPHDNVTIGAGHDYSVAWFIEESGTDVYNGSRISIGGGNSNGMGFFVDNAGNDFYAANGAFSFGAGGLRGSEDVPGAARRSIDVIGIFIDAEGFDNYEFSVAGMPINLGIADDMSWVLTQNPDPIVQRIEKGAGVDGTGESGFHARW